MLFVATFICVNIYFFFCSYFLDFIHVLILRVFVEFIILLYYFIVFFLVFTKTPRASEQYVQIDANKNLSLWCFTTVI